ncbi:MAG: Glycogen accumulation regulator GarA [Alphaproteobacteria bacterium ADurb.BinA280]|nr:FHA domain-containing protein [Xanthomonadales bacterium]MCC6504651.1 FHA domain-containing protein [Aquimonas sp.]OPZ12642.1 MAG: Glycogen accumulation regulator GarA [Alphaproteobacteria bacterium ADurb.BinA280]
MLLRLTAHLPDAPSKVQILHRPGSWQLGRASDCNVQVDHVSVSRRHARLDDDGDKLTITDLGSKNGLRVQGKPVAQAILGPEGWFSIGDVFCQLESLPIADWDKQQHIDAQRRTLSQTLAQRLRSKDHLDIIAELLKGFVELAECRRGFLLLGLRPEQLHVRACYAISPDDITDHRFAGSRSAVDRALRERRAIYMDSRQDQAWLSAQASVVAGGLRSLVCLPLLNEGELLGAVYADTDDSSRRFTDLDAELMSALVDQATTALVAQQIEQQLLQMESWLNVGSQSAQRQTQALHWQAPHS